MKKQFDVLVFVARCQPFHIGHEHVLKSALELADNVILLLGSSNRARSIRNPWSYEDRKSMIETCIPDRRLHIRQLNDYTYNDLKWVAQVQGIVQSFNDIRYEKGTSVNVGIIGHDKDSTTFYLKLFPFWESVEITPISDVNATLVRQSFFCRNDLWKHLVPKGTVEYLERWERHSPEYVYVMEDWIYVQDYKAQFNHLPFPPTFNTVDAVVIQSGHVLLIKRGAAPGRGLYALPGGFVGQAERSLDACIRELLEETEIKVPEKVLRGSLTGRDFFDDPHRSSRGRTFTHCFRFDLTTEAIQAKAIVTEGGLSYHRLQPLPKVKGADDAAEAIWFPIGNLPKQMFEDHGQILDKMLSF